MRDTPVWTHSTTGQLSLSSPGPQGLGPKTLPTAQSESNSWKPSGLSLIFPLASRGLQLMASHEAMGDSGGGEGAPAFCGLPRSSWFLAQLCPLRPIPGEANRGLSSHRLLCALLPVGR